MAASVMAFDDPWGLSAFLTESMNFFLLMCRVEQGAPESALWISSRTLGVKTKSKICKGQIALRCLPLFSAKLSKVSKKSSQTFVNSSFLLLCNSVNSWAEKYEKILKMVKMANFQITYSNYASNSKWLFPKRSLMPSKRIFWEIWTWKWTRRGAWSTWPCPRQCTGSILHLCGPDSLHYWQTILVID